jgi:hypothetical protein
VNNDGVLDRREFASFVRMTERAEPGSSPVWLLPGPPSSRAPTPQSRQPPVRTNLARNRLPPLASPADAAKTSPEQILDANRPMGIGGGDSARIFRPNPGWDFNRSD